MTMDSIPSSSMRRSSDDVIRSQLRIQGPLVRQDLSHKFETSVTRELMHCRGREGSADPYTLEDIFFSESGRRQWKCASYIQFRGKEFFEVSKVAAKSKQEKYDLRIFAIGGVYTEVSASYTNMNY